MTNLDYLYNKEAVKLFFNIERFVDDKLGYQIIEQGTILPHEKIIDGQRTKDGWGYGGIIDKNNKGIASSLVHLGAGSFYIPEEVQHNSETVIYLGMFAKTWGHCITDNINRLWFLKSDYFKNQFKNCPLVYLLCTKDSVFSLESHKSFRRLLEILEIDISKLKLIKQPTQFEKIILPSQSFYLHWKDGRQFTKEYREMISCVRNFALKNRTPTSTKKIYYFHGARQFGEQYLAEYFRSKGYEIIRPERLTLDEQLNLLINAESFASTIGSCSHNSVFLRNGTETILIPRASEAANGYQMTLDRVNPLNINYVDSTLSLFYRGNAAYCYIISEQLKKFFGDKFDGYKEEDFKIFLEYVKNQLSHKVNPKAKAYYSEFIKKFLAQLHKREDLIAAYKMPTDWEKVLS